MPSSERTRIFTLLAEIDKSLVVLERIDDFHRSYASRLPAVAERTQEHAIVRAEILVNYYTALETLFLRISQFFENNLAEHRWHQDLLHKMTLAIEGIREPVVADATASLLAELLKFRHFKRYYFEFDYDPRRIDYLEDVLERTRPLVRADLARFRTFLHRLAAATSD